MKLIVAVDERLGIGYNNDLLFSISSDKKYFKSMTTGKVVIMGHNTLKSLPNSLPFKNRTNIVLTRDESLRIQNALICNTLHQLFGLLSNYDTNDVFVIGGNSIYSQLIDYCNEAYITKIYAKREADRFFPNIDLDSRWELAEESDIETSENLNYRFCRYINKAPKVFCDVIDTDM